VPGFSVRVRAGRVYVRLSDLFQAAPPEVTRALAFLLVARLLSRKAPAAQERIYRSYAFSPNVLRASELARRQRGRKVISSAQGKVYDLDRMFARELTAHFHADFIHVAVGDGAVGPREIDVFKNAKRAALMLGERLNALQAVLVDDHDLARLDVADKLGVDQIERARFTRKHPGIADLPDAERAKSMRIANRQLAKKVRTALSKTKGLDITSVAIRARGGSIALSGSVPDATQIEKAGTVAQGVAGVTSVKNDLTVREVGQ